MKIGGSLLRKRDNLRRIVEALSLGTYPIVVVSAVKGVTDLLLAFAETGKGAYLDEVAAKYAGVFSVEESRVRDHLRDVEGIGGRGDPMSKDAIVSIGERLSCMLLAEELSRHGVEARCIEKPLLTDSNFGNASPLEVVFRPERGLSVVPGFVGIDSEGRWTTLGRGGSDLTATFIASRLGIRNVVLMTDVNGIHSVDPGTCSGAVTVPRMSVWEAIEFSSLRGKGFHPRTFEPVMGTDIVVHITSLEGGGTTIAGSMAPPHMKVVVPNRHGSYVIGYNFDDLPSYRLVGKFTAFSDMDPCELHKRYVLPLFNA